MATISDSQARAINAELDALAKKYNLSNFWFVGFQGEPGKGHFPFCIWNCLKPQFTNHSHVILSKAMFLQATEQLKSISGSAAYSVTPSINKGKHD